MDLAELRTLLWLRLRLFVNRLRRAKGPVPFFEVFVLAFGLLIAGVSLVGGAALGYFLLPSQGGVVTYVAFLVLSGFFTFGWVLGQVIDLQRGELIDLTRLLHLPVAPGQLFVINYVASLATLTVAVTVPGGVALCLGLWAAGKPQALLLVPLFLGFVFVLSSWTYWFQGWLSAFMSNPRKRKIVVMAMTGVLVIGFQLPNLVFNVIPNLQRAGQTGHVRHHRTPSDNQAFEHRFERFMDFSDVLPPFWVAAGARRAVEGDPRLAGLGTVFFALLGAFALRRGYREVLQFTQGAGTAVRARPAASLPRPRRRPFVERSFPLAPEPASAVAVASLRAALRAPELVLALAMGVFVLALTVFGLYSFRASFSSPAACGLALFGALSMSSMFLSPQLLNNVFGHDRDGLRSILLAPISARHILLGKNLAALPLQGPLLLVVILVGGTLLRLSPLGLLGALAQAVADVAFGLTLGNLLSLAFPFSIGAKGLRGPSRGSGAQFAGVIASLVAPMMLAPAALGPIWAYLHFSPTDGRAVPVSTAVSCVIAAFAVGLYAALLTPLGRLLDLRREALLAKLTTDA